MGNLAEYYGAVGPGWLQILKRLDHQLTYLKVTYTVRQVKEKFGTLRVYLAWTSDTDDLAALDIANTCVAGAERASATCCEQCGLWSQPRSFGGWIKNLCKECKRADV